MHRWEERHNDPQAICDCATEKKTFCVFTHFHPAFFLPTNSMSNEVIWGIQIFWRDSVCPTLQRRDGCN